MAARWVKGAGALLAAVSLVAVSACSSSGEPSSQGSGGGPVTVEFWGSAIGLDKSVALWNQTHSDVKIKYSQISAGSVGGYAKMLNSVKAGNAPCLGQVGYDTLPSFATSGAVEDISKYANPSKDEFAPWSWQMSSFGNQVFGVPVGLGPQALYYRSDLFKKFGITPPKTWDEFTAAAQKVHTADSGTYLTTTPQDAYDLGALAWQAGGKWFGTANSKWQVSIDSPETQKVAKYWQGLLDKDLVVSEPTLDTAWYKDLKDGRVLSYVGAVWAAPLIQQNVPGLSGKWSVAPMPQWTAGKQASGNRGGSATVVLKGCKNTQQATEFALWLSTSKASVTNLIKTTGLYPAARSGQEQPVLNQPSEYFGGQNISKVFKTAAGNISTNWMWGPTMTQVQPDFRDGLKKAGAGQGTIPRLVTTLQEKTVATMKSQGLGVSG